MGHANLFYILHSYPSRDPKQRQKIIFGGGGGGERNGPHKNTFQILSLKKKKDVRTEPHRFPNPPEGERIRYECQAPFGLHVCNQLEHVICILKK